MDAHVRGLAKSHKHAAQLTEGKKVLENVYFPAKLFLQEQLALNKFDIKKFIADTKGKSTSQVCL